MPLSVDLYTTGSPSDEGSLNSDDILRQGWDAVHDACTDESWIAPKTRLREETFRAYHDLACSILTLANIGEQSSMAITTSTLWTHRYAKIITLLLPRFLRNGERISKTMFTKSRSFRSLRAACLDPLIINRPCSLPVLEVTQSRSRLVLMRQVALTRLRSRQRTSTYP